jgi:hypothetical protein
MKKYARRNKRMPLEVKYRWRGMAKSNFRKQGKRRIEMLTDCERFGVHIFDWESEGLTLFPPNGTPCVCGMVLYEADTNFDSTDVVQNNNRPMLEIVYE